MRHTLPVGVVFGHSIVEIMSGLAPSAHSSIGLNNHAVSPINQARQRFPGVNLDIFRGPTPTGMTGANQGRSGETLGPALIRMATFPKDRLDFVIIDHGINNFWQGGSASQYLDQMDHALDLFPRSVHKFVCNNRVPRGEAVDFPQEKINQVLQANSALPDLCAVHSAIHLDVNAAYNRNPDLFYDRLLHPNVQGSQRESYIHVQAWQRFFPNIPFILPEKNLLPTFTDRSFNYEVYGPCSVQAFPWNDEVQPDGTVPQLLHIKSSGYGRIVLSFPITLPKYFKDQWMQAVFPVQLHNWSGFAGVDVQVNGYAGGNTPYNTVLDQEALFDKRDVHTEVFQLPPSFISPVHVILNIYTRAANSVGYAAIYQPHFGLQLNPWRLR